MVERRNARLRAALPTATILAPTGGVPARATEDTGTPTGRVFDGRQTADVRRGSGAAACMCRRPAYSRSAVAQSAETARAAPTGVTQEA